MLNADLREKVEGYFQNLSGSFTLAATVDAKHPKREELCGLLAAIADCSPRISCSFKEGRGLEFSLLKDSRNTRIKYRSTPNGQEFTSLILAILHADGQGRFPNDSLLERMCALSSPVKFTTYVSLNCPACSEVVESLNLLTLLNENISHEIVDGAINKMEIIDREIMALPTVYADDKLLFIGMKSLEEIISELENKF